MASPATSTGLTPKRRQADWRAFVAAGCFLAAASAVGADPKLLPPEQAFRFSARALDDRTVEARFAVEDGYYLYRDKLKFAVEPTVVAIATAGPAGRQGQGRPVLRPGRDVPRRCRRQAPAGESRRGTIDRACRRLAGLRGPRHLLPGQSSAGHAGHAGGRQGARSRRRGVSAQEELVQLIGRNRARRMRVLLPEQAPTLTKADTAWHLR